MGHLTRGCRPRGHLTREALASASAARSLFLTAKAAEGASPKTIEWYRMVPGRTVRDVGADRGLDALTPAELRDWLQTLRATLAPVSVAGYVRGLKVFGNWCSAEELAEAKGPSAPTPLTW